MTANLTPSLIEPDEVDRIAEQIRAALVPAVASAFPWSEMAPEQREGYRSAAIAAAAALQSHLEQPKTETQ